MACFLVFCSLVFEASADFGNEDGAVMSGMERYEDDTWDGEKPRTTLVVLCSDDSLFEVPTLERIELVDGGVADDALVSGAEMIGSAAAAFGDGCFADSGAR